MLSQYQTSLNREHIKTILLVYSLSVLIGIGMKRQKTKAQSRVMPVTVKSTVSSMIKKDISALPLHRSAARNAV